MKKLPHRIMIVGIGVALAGAPNARASEPQCGDVVTEDVVLNADLLECPGDGLVVAGDDVTVDLNHHRVDGTGTGAGVRIMAREVTLRHGAITDFGAGVQVHSEGPEDAWLADLNVSFSNRGIVLAGGGFSSRGTATVTIV